MTMENNLAQKITTLATILALPFALGAFLLTWAPAKQFNLTDPAYDGFVQPRSIAKIVEITQDSTVTVFCDYTPGSRNQELKKLTLEITNWALDPKSFPFGK